MDRKILVSIITIDRDAYAIEKVHHAIKHLFDRENIYFLVVCRDSDIECQQKWRNLVPKIKLITVPHYNIVKRHNMQNVCNKRNIALNYAKENNFDYLFFIDSDIIVQKDTLEILLTGCEKYHADVCSIPYAVKWLGYIVTGVQNGHYYNYITIDCDESQEVTYEKGGGCMGCTLIKSTVFHIPFNVQSLRIKGRIVTGEDIGFFLSLVRSQFSALYVKNHKIDHL